MPSTMSESIWVDRYLQHITAIARVTDVEVGFTAVDEVDTITFVEDALDCCVQFERLERFNHQGIVAGVVALCIAGACCDDGVGTIHRQVPENLGRAIAVIAHQFLAAGVEQNQRRLPQVAQGHRPDRE